MLALAMRWLVGLAALLPTPLFAAETQVGSLPQWDSIAHLSIVMSFEERLGRQLTSEEIVSLETVASFAALFPAGDERAPSV